MQKLLFPDLKNAASITLSENSSCFEMIWEEGEYIKPEDYDLSTLEFVFEKNPPKNKIDFLVSDLGCLLVSKRLKDSLIEAKIDNICFYPASIIIEDEREYYSEFYVINISKLESCIDVENSEYRGRIKDGQLISVRRITKLILLPTYSAICRVKFFRRLIVVSGAALKVFNDAKYTGIKLIDPIKWDGFMGEKNT